MDNNTTPQPNIHPSTGWHLTPDGTPLHRNVLIAQLRAVGYLASVSISVPDLRTLHATTLAAAVPAKPAVRTRKPIAHDSPEFARSLKNLTAAAARKAARTAAGAA